MPDSTIDTIDRFFDLVDRGVDKLDRVLNRSKCTQDQHLARRSTTPRTKSRAITAVAETSRRGKSGSSERRPRFYIVESVASGTTRFVVTDGGDLRSECVTREHAEKFLRALEAS